MSSEVVLFIGKSGIRYTYFVVIHNIHECNIHLSNVLTDHFLNSLPEKTTKGIPMKFSQCPFKNIFYRLSLSNCDIYLQIIHVRKRLFLRFTARASHA